VLRGIPNKREHLARLLGRLGVLGLLERSAAAWQPGLVVLTYHRLTELGANQFYDPVISATAESFRAQVEWLQSHVEILTLSDLIAQLDSRLPSRKPAVLLTFDDGYRDNFDSAVPILREYKVPATFFIPTGLVESPRLPWWDYIAYVIKQTRTRQLTLERNALGSRTSSAMVINLEILPKAAAIGMIIREFLDGRISDEAWFLKQLGDRAEVDVDQDGLGRALFMSWDQIQAIPDASAGLAIGSHAHSHQRLASLDNEAQRSELTQSKQILEQRLGREITAVAYPYGWAGTYTATTKLLAAEAGYRLAFTSREGVNRPSTLDHYEINRLGVGSSDSAVLLRGRAALQSLFGASFL
jgi:peptidoglycan/xylan/chitin deacetylase (PgdA/CDA1 family)